MTSFKTRIRSKSKESGRIILANDYDTETNALESKTLKNITTLHKYLCAIKLNFHLLLPLGKKEINKITKTAHSYGLEVIADIKLNDIGNTNLVTTQRLWDLGFDAVIANPIMGIDSLKQLISNSHKTNHGVITLCHMSAPSAKYAYELDVKQEKKKVYQIFLEWALNQKADGIIVGATYPDVIKYCKSQAKNKLDIYSPGVGTQGGQASEVINAGSDFLIVGRTILNAKNPLDTTKKLSMQS